MSTLTITTIQTDLVWEDKVANLRNLQSKIEGIGERTELVILPEMFSTGFSMNAVELAETMDGPTVQWMRQIAGEHKIILTGSLIIKEQDHFYNRLVWMLPNGQFGYYDKRHLFCLSGEENYYSSGNKRLIASVKGWKINLQICYDLRFPVWSRNRKVDVASQDLNTTAVEEAEQASEYDVLIFVANWPSKRINAWKALLTARAIENQCFAIGVNRVGVDGNNLVYNGNTLVADPLGNILYEVVDKEDVSTITLTKKMLEEVRTQLPFWKDGDSFTFL
ncbi:MAG: nitrilase family protein [Ferruginibacter sp.]|nr:nitrilase family protein [Ferruginibacter sp.]